MQHFLFCASLRPDLLRFFLLWIPGVVIRFMQESKIMKKIVLIDSHAIIHRAFHALPPLTDSHGEPVNAVYGFASILLRILKELQPDYLAAAFDMPGKTFRHEQYEDYKAHRPPTPDELKSQFSKVHELVEAFGIPAFQKE